MTPEQELARADKASQILTSEAYKEAVREAQEYILNLIVMTDDTDRDRFHALGLRLKQHHFLIRQLQGFMETGKMVEEQIKRKSFFKV